MTDTDPAERATETDETERFPTAHAVSHHTLELPGRSLSYRAEAGWITLRKIHKPVAHVFHTAYFVASEGGDRRPLTFVFNGGPGAASAYLHMGALGPRRVAFAGQGQLPQPPTRVVDNAESWLSFSDLVFIDPVGTGFSRALKDTPGKKESEESKPSGPEENSEFWEVERDLDSLGEFMCRFLSRHHRWTSPVLIAGESYGGFRVAKMARRLQEKFGVGLNGAILISPALETDGLTGTDYDFTYWIELFPSLAATAWHHGRSNLNGTATLAEVLQQGEAFARNELVQWLVHGDTLGEDQRRQYARQMSDLIGLDAATIERAAGRISATRFCRELLRDQRRLCGRYDGSITTADPFPDRHGYEGPDPTLFSIDRLFTGSINHHLRDFLQLETELDYRLLSFEVHESWKDAGRKEHVFRKLAGAVDDLRYGMSLNEHMRVFITHGYFDLITPYFSSGRLVDAMKLTDVQRGRLSVQNYHGGHMYYSWDDSRQTFHADARAFYEAACQGPAESG